MRKNRRELLSPIRQTGKRCKGSATASSALQGVVSEQGSEERIVQVSDQGSEDRCRSIGRDELGNVRSDLARDGSSDPRNFLCYRPNCSDPPFSLVLLEAGFDSFLKDARDLEQLQEEDIEAADELCKQLNSREFVSNHEDRVEYIQEVLADYWNVFVHTISMRKFTTDAAVVIINQVVALVLEFKSVLGNSGEQYPQGVLRCCRKSAGRKSQRSQYGLLLCFAGANMQVSAYFYDAKRDTVWCEPLTWSFCYGPRNNVNSCAAVLRAVKRFCGSYVSETSSVPWMLRSLDSVRTGRNLFMYGKKNRLVVAKFVRTYSEEAHKAWSEAGVAPNLFKVEENVADGWTLLHLEYMGVGWTSADELVREQKRDAGFIGRLSKEIEKAVRAGHRAGFVHGDLRLPNILVETTTLTVNVVGFDWAGAVGMATYPEVPNRRHCWPPGVKYKQPILPDHDLWFAKHLVEQLGSITS